MSLRIGVDLGGTKIEAVAIAADGAERFRKRIDAPRGDYGASLTAIVSLVREVEVSSGERPPVGIGIPGVISPATGVVKNANSTWLNGRPLHADLERALERPVRLANDANCFALSEATDGAGAGAHVVFGAILGTGTGGGVVVGGRVLVGANAIAGEWGHNPLPWPDATELPGAPCYCGRRGCIETFLSGAGLQAARGRSDVTAREIAEAASQSDPAAVAAVETYTRRLAKSLATIINTIDPDVIVLGGGLSNIASLYTQVPRLWSAWVFSDRVDTRLARARHGDASGVRGAAWLNP